MFGKPQTSFFGSNHTATSEQSSGAFSFGQCASNQSKIENPKNAPVNLLNQQKESLKDKMAQQKRLVKKLQDPSTITIHKYALTKNLKTLTASICKLNHEILQSEVNFTTGNPPGKRKRSTDPLDSEINFQNFSKIAKIERVLDPFTFPDINFKDFQTVNVMDGRYPVDVVLKVFDPKYAYTIANQSKSNRNNFGEPEQHSSEQASVSDIVNDDIADDDNDDNYEREGSEATGDTYSQIDNFTFTKPPILLSTSDYNHHDQKTDTTNEILEHEQSPVIDHENCENNPNFINDKITLIPLNKEILCSLFDYFKALYNKDSNWTEPDFIKSDKNEKFPVATLTDFDPATVVAFFIGVFKNETNVTFKNITELLRLSNYLNDNTAKTELLSIIANNINETNVIDIHLKIEYFLNTDIGCFDWIKKNISKYPIENFYHSLDLQNFKLVWKWLNSYPDIYIDSIYLKSFLTGWIVDHFKHVIEDLDVKLFQFLDQLDLTRIFAATTLENDRLKMFQSFQKVIKSGDDFKNVYKLIVENEK